jgi:hypothetical protein
MKSSLTLLLRGGGMGGGTMFLMGDPTFYKIPVSLAKMNYGGAANRFESVCTMPPLGPSK